MEDCSIIKLKECKDSKEKTEALENIGYGFFTPSAYLVYAETCDETIRTFLNKLGDINYSLIFIFDEIKEKDKKLFLSKDFEVTSLDKYTKQEFQTKFFQCLKKEMGEEYKKLEITETAYQKFVEYTAYFDDEAVTFQDVLPEIKKISCVSHIDEKLIQEVVINNSQENIWQIIDMILKKDKRVFQKVERLLQNQSPYAFIGALEQKYRLLYKKAILSKEDFSSIKVFGRLPVMEEHIALQGLRTLQDARKKLITCKEHLIIQLLVSKLIN